jgi:hypothetical protein
MPFYHISIDPVPIVAAWGAVFCTLCLAVVPRPLAWSVMAAYWAMGLLYEWCHYVVHTRVPFKSGPGKVPLVGASIASPFCVAESSLSWMLGKADRAITWAIQTLARFCVCLIMTGLRKLLPLRSCRM